MRRLMNECLRANDSKRQYLHSRNLSHDDIHGISSWLRDAPWVGTVVATDTTSVDATQYTPLAQPVAHENYARKYLVERVSWYAAHVAEPVNLVFERSGSLHVLALREYLGRCRRKRDPLDGIYDDSYIDYLDWDWLSLDRINSEPKANERLLGFADFLAYAVLRAIEPNRQWERLEPSYFEAIEQKLWRGPGDEPRLFRYGLALMPSPKQKEFIREFACLSSLWVDKKNPSQ